MRHCSGWNLNNLAVILIVAGSMPLTGDHSAAAEVSAEIGGRFESNASNSDQPGDRLADGFLTVRADAAGTVRIGGELEAGPPLRNGRGSISIPGAQPD